VHNWARGFGNNVYFVRALGKIQGLEELVVEGYYAKEWPAYLEERIGVRVQVIYGKYCELTDNEKLNDFNRKDNERQPQIVTEYQRGTEDLFP
jgi:hypothetical protein